ncbi:urease accessory protein UreD [Streptomyces sp. Wh19]
MSASRRRPAPYRSHRSTKRSTPHHLRHHDPRFARHAPEHTTYDAHLTVVEHAELHWRPKPLICVAGSNQRQTWTVGLAPTARFVSAPAR